MLSSLFDVEHQQARFCTQSPLHESQFDWTRNGINLVDSELTDPRFRADEHEVRIARQDVQPDRSVVEPGFQVDERLAVPSTDDGATPLVSEPSNNDGRPRMLASELTGKSS